MQKTPKYKQIEEYIKNEIIANNLKEGDQILTEEQLCEKFNFSRMTINKALLHLVESGYIKRIAGKGSFVASPHVLKQLGAQTSFTEDMKSIGLSAGSRLISYRVLRGEDLPEIAKMLELKNDDLIHHFIRLRTGDGEPIAISYTYVSSLVLPAIDVKSLDGSFYEYVDSLNFIRCKTTGDMMAVLATDEQKQILGIRDAALLKISHLSYVIKDHKEVPFEYINTCYVGNRYTYHFQSK